MSAVLVSSTGSVQSFADTATPIPKPLGVQLGDLLPVSLLMNGTPSLPAGWVLKESGDDANVVVYARVDGTNIPAVDDGQTFTFGNGGGAVYFSSLIGLVRGAIASGDPFDGDFQSALPGGASNQSPPLAVTTTEDDVLLILFEHNFVNATVTGATSPLVVDDGAANATHVASGPQPVAGPSGNKTMTYSASIAGSYAQLGAIVGEPPVPGNGLTAGGRDRFTVRRTPKNRRRYR